MIGFVALGGFGLAILAGVVMLPAYGRLVRARYQRDCLKAQNARMQTRADAGAMIIAAENDQMLIRRLAASRLRLQPANEIVIRDPQNPPAGNLIEPVDYPRPPRPGGWVIRVADRLEKRSARRGLFVVAVGLMTAAMFMFLPPQRRRGDLRPAAPERSRRS